MLKEKPVVPEDAGVLVTPKPVKEFVVVPEGAAKLAGTVVKEATEVVEEENPNGGTENDPCVVVVVVTGVEALVVVTVENNGAADVDVPRDRAVGFVAGVVETGAADEARLAKAKDD